MRPRVRVYIPTFNGADLLERALASLERQSQQVGVVVIDNGSADDSVVRVRRRFGDAHIVQLPRNLGFGRAINEGIRRHPADWVILVNNDVECKPRFIEALLEARGRGVDMVAGVLLQAASPGRIDSAGVVVDETLLSFDYMHDSPADAALRAWPPLGPTGGAAAYRHEALARVGGFDERIFAYLEDVDLALRLRSTGARCQLAGYARAVHRHSATLGSGSARKNALMGWSRGYLLRRYGILEQPRLAARAIATEAVICAGQLVIDRTITGTSARVHGWRTAGPLDRRSTPPGATIELSLDKALRNRLRRRSTITRLAPHR